MSDIVASHDSEQERKLMVVRLYAESRDKNYIQSQTGVPPAAQKKIIAEFNEYSRNDLYTQQRGREIVGQVDQHFSSLISQLYSVVDEADMNSDYKIKASTLKMIAELEAKRVDVLQRAGVLSAQSVGDEVAQTAIKHKKILDLLKSIAAKDKNIAREIAEGIADIEGQVISVRVVEENE